MALQSDTASDGAAFTKCVRAVSHRTMTFRPMPRLPINRQGTIRAGTFLAIFNVRFVRFKLYVEVAVQSGKPLDPVAKRDKFRNRPLPWNTALPTLYSGNSMQFRS